MHELKSLALDRLKFSYQSENHQSAATKFTFKKKSLSLKKIIAKPAYLSCYAYHYANKQDTVACPSLEELYVSFH